MKFCGMMHNVDALHAAALGAAYVGVVFAPGPRRLDCVGAAAVLHGLPKDTRRVGVFAGMPTVQIAALAGTLSLDIVQLHGDDGVAEVEALRPLFTGEIWVALRIAGPQLPAAADGIGDAADGMVLDARVEGMLGGTGVILPWRELATSMGSWRCRGRIILAGGLNPGNVELAIATLHPDIVDVSSGVESSPGIKDHQKMNAFVQAVAHADGKLAAEADVGPPRRIK